MTDKLIAGTRGSKLALWQTNFVAGSLDCEVEIQKITTRGDKIQDVALAKIEGKAFFTKEIDDALVRGDVDFAVHSFKDVPTDLPDGMIIAALPERASCKDALVGPYRTFQEMPAGTVVGTASIRRKALARSIRQDLELKDLRGNIDTRVRKQQDGEYDAIITAEAALVRMEYEDYHPLDPTEFIPAAGQGAMAITAMDDRQDVLEVLKALDHRPTRIACEAERLFLQTLEGGCQVPAGVYTDIDQEQGTIEMTGFISTLDGHIVLKETDTRPIGEHLELSKKLADHLLNSGGREILDKIREEGL